jgi:hypothetical protein
MLMSRECRKKPRPSPSPDSKPIKADGEEKQRSGEVGHETRGRLRYGGGPSEVCGRPWVPS